MTPVYLIVVSVSFVSCWFSLLEHIVMVARHLTLYGRSVSSVSWRFSRLSGSSVVCRTVHMVEELSHKIREPLMAVHCGHMCSSTQSVIHVKITAVKLQNLVGSLVPDSP